MDVSEDLGSPKHGDRTPQKQKHIFWNGTLAYVAAKNPETRKMKQKAIPSMVARPPPPVFFSPLPSGCFFWPATSGAISPGLPQLHAGLYSAGGHERAKASHARKTLHTPFESTSRCLFLGSPPNWTLKLPIKNRALPTTKWGFAFHGWSSWVWESEAFRRTAAVVLNLCFLLRVTGKLLVPPLAPKKQP